jgi:hypothetical protein
MSRTKRFDESGRKDGERDVSRRDVLRSTGVALGVTAGLAGLSTSASAERGRLFEIANERTSRFDGFTQFRASVAGSFDRITSDVSETTASTVATETTDVFNSNASTLVSYANNQITDGVDKTTIDTLRVKFTKAGDAERRFIVVGVDQEANDFTTASMVESTDREIDEWVHLEALAADNAADELESFVDEYAAENKPIDAELKGRLAGRYAPDVKSSLID